MNEHKSVLVSLRYDGRYKNTFKMLIIYLKDGPSLAPFSGEVHSLA